MKLWQNIKELIHYSSGGIVSKKIFSSDKMELGLYCMAAGTEMSEHTSTREVIVHVLEGKGVFKLGREEIAMAPGVLIHMNPDDRHSLKAEEDTSFTLIMIG